jgi:hypothetical protein
MRSFYGKQELKDKLVCRALDHLNADSYYRGQWGEFNGGKFIGCAIGCLATPLEKTTDAESFLSLPFVINSDYVGPAIINGPFDHLRREFGLSVALTKPAERIFEQVIRDDEDAYSWPLTFVSAIRVGSDFSQGKLNRRLKAWMAEYRRITEGGGYRDEFWELDEDGWAVGLLPEIEERLVNELLDIARDGEPERSLEELIESGAKACGALETQNVA